MILDIERLRAAQVEQPSLIDIEATDEHGNLITDDAFVLHFPADQQQQQERYYFCTRQHVLGEGTFGRVEKAYVVDGLTGEVQLDQPVAVKIAKSSEVPLSQIEQSALEAYFPKTEPLIESDGHQILVTEFIDGKSLDQYSAEELNELTFEERCYIVWQLVEQLHLIHHETPQTGSAILHRDIKPQNIMFDLENKQIFLVDYGLIMPFEEYENAPDEQLTTRRAGTRIYLPPEAAIVNQDGHAVISARGDVFSLVPAVMKLFGANDPLSIRKATHTETGDHQLVSRTRFSDDQMFMGYTTPEPLEVDGQQICINTITARFINLMGDLDINKRPSSDICLRFFTNLQKINIRMKTAENNQELENDEDFRTELAELLFLSTNPKPSQKFVKEALRYHDTPVVSTSTDSSNNSSVRDSDSDDLSISGVRTKNDLDMDDYVFVIQTEIEQIEASFLECFDLKENPTIVSALIRMGMNPQTYENFHNMLSQPQLLKAVLPFCDELGKLQLSSEAQVAGPARRQLSANIENLPRQLFDLADINLSEHQQLYQETAKAYQLIRKRLRVLRLLNNSQVTIDNPYISQIFSDNGIHVKNIARAILFSNKNAIINEINEMYSLPFFGSNKPGMKQALNEFVSGNELSDAQYLLLAQSPAAKYVEDVLYKLGVNPLSPDSEEDLSAEAESSRYDRGNSPS